MQCDERAVRGERRGRVVDLVIRASLGDGSCLVKRLDQCSRSRQRIAPRLDRLTTDEPNPRRLRRLAQDLDALRLALSEVVRAALVERDPLGVLGEARGRVRTVEDLLLGRVNLSRARARGGGRDAREGDRKSVV